MSEEKTKYELLEKLLTDLLELNRKLVYGHQELTADQSSIKAIIKDMENTIRQLKDELHGDGDGIGVQEKLRSQAADIIQLKKDVHKISTIEKSLVLIKAKQALIWKGLMGVCAVILLAVLKQVLSLIGFKFLD